MPKGQYKNPKERAKKIADAKRRGSYFNCLVCDKKLWRKPYDIKMGNNKFCSRPCYFEWLKGRKRSDGFRIKCSKGQKQRYKGKVLISPQNKLIRSSKEFREWRQKVFEKDNWTCQKCSKRSKANQWLIIHAHHIKPFAVFPKLRFVVDNGMTLCKKCHAEEPKGKEIFNLYESD